MATPTTNQIVRFALSDKGATAAAGINVTNTEIANKIEVAKFTAADALCLSVQGITADYSGNVYFSDVVQSAIWKLSEGGELSLLAGIPGTSGNNTGLQNVPLLEAKFDTPQGMACDRSGNIYVADAGNNQIRVINGRGVSVLAGAGDGSAGHVDAPIGTPFGPLAARFDYPIDVEVDKSGLIYVADRDNNAIRKIDGGKVLTIAGIAGAGADLENVLCNGKDKEYFDRPRAVCVDNDGTLIVCDTDNNKIKKIDKSGWLYLFSGAGGASAKSLGDLAPGSNHLSASIADGGIANPYTCRYFFPYQSDMDSSGNTFFLDRDSADTGGTGTRLIMLDQTGVPNVVCDFTGSTEGDRSITLTVTPSQKIFVTMYEA